MSIDYNTKRKRCYKNTLISALIAIVIHIARHVGIFPELLVIPECILIVATLLFGFGYLQLVFSTRRK